MEKNNLIILIVIISIIAAFLFIITSGFTFKTEVDKTWGQKDPATIKDLYIVNSAGNNSDDDYGTNYYYVEGYVGNKAQSSASNVIITAYFYDEKGTLIGTNKTTPDRPQKIPSEGKSHFFVDFKDPNNKIVSYKLKISF
jgi:hypothetical protein